MENSGAKDPVYSCNFLKNQEFTNQNYTIDVWMRDILRYLKRHLKKPQVASRKMFWNVLSVWWYILIPLNTHGKPAQTGPNLRSFHISKKSTPKDLHIWNNCVEE